MMVRISPMDICFAYLLLKVKYYLGFLFIPQARLPSFYVPFLLKLSVLRVPKSQCRTYNSPSGSLKTQPLTQELPPGFLYKVFVLSLQGHCHLSSLCTLFWFSSVWVLLLLSSSSFCVFFFFQICFPFTLIFSWENDPKPVF